MGIFFNNLCPICWETEEYCKCNKEDREKYEHEKNNHVYKQFKKAIFRGIDLTENDIITPQINGNQYIIRNFLENGTPIVTLISSEKHDYWDKEWEFDTLFVIKSAI